MTVTALESGVQTQEAELKFEPPVFQTLRLPGPAFKVQLMSGMLGRATSSLFPPTCSLRPGIPFNGEQSPALLKSMPKVTMEGVEGGRGGRGNIYT